MALTDAGILSLGDLAEGGRAYVRQVKGGQAYRGRMAALGFTIGAPLQLLQNTGRGPVIVLIRGMRVALGRGEALKVLIAPGDGGNDQPQR